MRQGQQNRRGRGRNNNNNNHQHNRRGGQNPLTRSFESTGPDTKIRGTPAHIAEKYMTLARDALSSGDPVLAENYLQHAEHYNRIIMAYREQMHQSGEVNGGPQPMIARFRPGPQDPMSPGDEFGEGEGEEFADGQQPQPVIRQNDLQPPGFENGAREAPRESQRFDDRPPRHEGQHQPRHQNQPRERQQGDRNFDRRERFDNRSDRPERQDRPDRQDRQERFDRGDRNDRNEPRFERQPRVEGQIEGDAGQGRAPRPQGSTPVHEQPEFLRRPLRRPRRDDVEGTAAPAPAGAGAGVPDEPGQD